MKTYIRLLLVPYSLFLTPVSAQTIVTVAGGGMGNKDSAIKVGMQPNGVTLDNSGNLYISDGINNTIREVNVASDILTAFAGNGTPGYTGNGGQATSAQLNNAQGVCLDNAGNVYEADMNNDVIRVISPSGIISTFAGIGVPGFSGDGGPATAAELEGPTEVEADRKGNIYIADYFNQRIRMVNTAGIITTIAGCASRGNSGNGGPATAAELDYPDGVTADTAGNIYIADDFSNNIRVVNKAGIISLVAGNSIAGFSGDGGPATAAEMFNPSTVFVDVHGNIYFGDQNNNRIRKVDAAGIITTIAGNGAGGFGGDGGQATDAELFLPQGVYVDSLGDVYIADFGNYRTRMINPKGIISTITGNGSLGYYGNGVAATSAELLLPQGITFDNSGNMYIADNQNYRIHKIDKGDSIFTFAGNGYDGFSGDGGPATAAEFDFPTGVAADATGNIYIADEYNQRIRMVNTSGIVNTVAGDTGSGYGGDGMQATASELWYPCGVTVDAKGNMYIADAANERIRMVNTSGIISTIAGISTGGYSGDGGPATAAELAFPTGVTVGDSGNIYIADEENNAIRKINSAGIITTIAGNGIRGYYGDGGPATDAELNYPYSVICDKFGDVFIADNLNNVIRMVLPGGIITTYAGDSVKGFSGDGGPALAAEMHGPDELAFDASGNLYLADNSNNRIREITDNINAGINKLDLSEKTSIYPNPNNGVFTIIVKNEKLKMNNLVEIYNVLGEKVFQSNIQHSTFSIDLSFLPGGVYLYRVVSEKGELIGDGKFVVQ
jgi:sugar lactone lactonase YvrE